MEVGGESDTDSDTESICSTLSEASSTGAEPSSKVYVGSNLPPHITKEHITQHFSKHGFGDTVTSVRVFYTHGTHKSRCGYVTLTSAEHAQEAIHKLNGSLLLGEHRLVVRSYQRKRKRPPPKSAGNSCEKDSNTQSPSRKQRSRSRQSSSSSYIGRNLDLLEPYDSDPEPSSGEFCKVFVGSNLPNSIDGRHLRDHFREFKADMLDAQIVRDHKTKLTKGYGFITFSSKRVAEKAIRKLNGSKLHGQFTLSVELKTGRRHSQSNTMPLSPQRRLSSNQPHQKLQRGSQGANPPNDVEPRLEPNESKEEEICKIFVGSHLPDFITTEHIHEHFKEFEEAIVSYEMVRDETTNRSKGFGHITFTSQRKAEEATSKLNDSKLWGRFPLTLGFVTSGQKQHNQQWSPQTHSHSPRTTAKALPLLKEITPNNIIEIVNLNPHVSEEEIRTMIRVRIIHISLQPHLKTAIITLSTPSDASIALAAIDGKNLLGGVVSASLYHPPPPPLPTPDLTEQHPRGTTYPKGPCLQAGKKRTTVTEVVKTPTGVASGPELSEIVTVKVTNLPQIKQKALRNVFEIYGNMSSIRIVVDKVYPCYAYVNYYTLAAAQAACANLHNTTLRGKQMQVQLFKGVEPAPTPMATPKSHKPPHHGVNDADLSRDVKNTTLYFSIPYSTGTRLPNPISRANFQQYLTHHLKSKVGVFKVSRLTSLQHQTEIQVQFSSLNRAKKALKILKPLAHHDFTVSLTECSPKTLLSEIESFRNSIESKTNQFVAQQRIKLENLNRELKVLQIPKKCPMQLFEKLDGQRKVVQQQADECQHQKEEFEGYCKLLLEHLQHLELSAPATTKPLEEKVATMRKDFGRECSRFLKALPIYAKRREIVEAVRNNQVVILIGETGSGKSTQIVQYLYDAGFAEKGIIACTQPRKVAAITLATHVSTEMCVKLGTVLGYKMGMSGKHGEQTKVLYLTDHALLNECIADQDFSKYSCLVIDEAHERSLHTDLLLAFIKQLLPRRNDLRVVITSATIDPWLFKSYFGGDCPIIRVPGRTFPVDIVWNAHKVPNSDCDTALDSPISMNHVTEAMKVAKRIHTEEDTGDILVFLTSPPEIERACQTISQELDNRAVILPLHGKLQPQEQQRVFHDFEGKRKIILATNIAETSVTIHGVKYIVDTGLAKELCFDPKRNMNSLEVRLISKSSAEQRKGRAGRTSAGKCYRLYSQDLYEEGMPDRMRPEILRVHLSHAALKLYEFGVTNILDFDFVEHPNPVALKSAVETLEFLRAVQEGRLTDLGRKMAVLSLDPQLGKVLLDGIEAGIGMEAAVAVAISSLAGNVFFRGGTDEMKSESDKKKVQFCHPSGDQLTYLSVYYKWAQQKKEQRNQWCVDNCINAKSMRMVDETIKEFRDTLARNLSIQLPSRVISLENAEAMLPKLYFDTFIRNVSVFIGHERAGYITESMPGEPLVIFPGSTLCQLNQASQCVVYEKTLKTSQRFLMQVLPVKEEWIQEAIELGKLQCHPADRFREWMVSPVNVTNIGQAVFRAVINRYKLPEIKAQLEQVCEGTRYVLQPEHDKGMVTVFSQRKYHTKVVQVINGYLSSERENLKKIQYEGGLTKPEDDVHLVMGLGGSVMHVLMPYHYRKVVVKGPPDASWKEDLLQSLSQHGEIEREESKVFKKQECRLFVTFRNPDDAVQAVTTLQAPEGITIAPQLQQQSGEAGSQFTLKIEWVRRQRRPFAFIDFSCPEDLQIARTYLGLHHQNSYPLLVSGSLVRFRPSKEENKLQLYVGNVGQQVTEEALKSAVEHAVPGVEVEVHIGFEKSFETTAEQLDAMKKQLGDLIGKYSKPGNCNVDLKPPRNSFVTFRTFVRFKDPSEGQQALRGLKYEEIGGKVLNVEPILFSSVRYTPAVYIVIENAVKELKLELQNRYEGSVKINEKQDKWGNTIIEIRSDDVQAFVVAKNVLNSVIQPDVTECLSPILRQFVLSRNCSQELNEIQSSTSTYIYADRRTMAIKIYGTEANQTRAKIQLNDRLSALVDHEITQYELKAPGRPPGLMKHLVSVCGLDLHGLTEQEGIMSATLDPRRHILTVFATTDAHKSVAEQIEEYSALNGAQPTLVVGEDEVECCVCFTPIENAREIFRLEYCGHPYHLDCIQLQTAPNAIAFPLQCAAEECAHPFVWKDCENLFQRSNFTLRQLAKSSLKSFMKANKQIVRNCTTPDCDMVYVISDDGKRFICSHCGVHLCTKCHEQYHDGLTCAMYQAGKHGEKEFEEWLRKDQQNRKRCPKCVAPIEKINGCNNVCCSQCRARICWVCLRYFNSDQDCYAHLATGHGGFV